MPSVGTAAYHFAALFFSELSIFSLAKCQYIQRNGSHITICQEGIGHICMINNCYFLYSNSFLAKICLFLKSGTRRFIHYMCIWSCDMYKVLISLLWELLK